MRGRTVCKWIARYICRGHGVFDVRDGHFSSTVQDFMKSHKNTNGTSNSHENIEPANAYLVGHIATSVSACLVQTCLCIYIQTCANMSRPDGKPFCECGRRKLSNLSPKLQLTWAASENEKWSRLEGGTLAYFKFCQECHMRRWPDDMRQQGPWCRPAVAPWARWREEDDGVCRLLSGDFFLTRSPPELRRTGRLGGAPAAARSRSRSPARGTMAKSVHWRDAPSKR